MSDEKRNDAVHFTPLNGRPRRRDANMTVIDRHVTDPYQAKAWELVEYIRNLLAAGEARA